MSDDLNRRSRSFAELEISKAWRREALHLGGAIRDSRQGVTQKTSFRISAQCQSGSSVRVSTWSRLADALPERRCQLPLVLLCATAISKLSGGNQRA